MDKKRVLLAVLLLGIFLVTASQVLAGCCVGIIGCSRAFFESECSELATFNSQECAETDACDIVACCHNVPSMPKATYRSTCLSMTPPDPTRPIALTYIKPFTTNPAAESAYANSLCSGARPPCQFVSCQQANTENCMCGGSVTSSSSLYCCARDNSVFPTFGACTSSPNCRSGNFYNIHGRVVSPAGRGISGAEVRAGGKQVLTDENGNYTVDLIPDLSSGSVFVIKNSTINSTPYTMRGADIYGVDVILDVVVRPTGPVEDCAVEGDQDGDQFSWASADADRCDSDCNLALSRTVTQTYFTGAAESSVGRDWCSDRFDNDCDGAVDCADPDCVSSSACLQTFCGDGIVSFPNAEGQYEQCDMEYALGRGNDSLCPGKCVEEGNPRECTCQYEATCGNGIIDEPLEDCDGRFIAATNRWDPGSYATTDCDILRCGKPGSVYPCQCPPPQVCGNGKKEGPEECDPGGMPGAKSPPEKTCPDRGICNPDCTCPSSPIVCGNNLLERGEDCDGALVDNAWQSSSFRTRKYGCNQNLCAVPEITDDSVADDEPVYSAIDMSVPGGVIRTFTKDDYAGYLGVLGVNSACKCPTNCRAGPLGPNLGPLQQTRFVREIKLKWEDECYDKNARAYNIFRCEADDSSDGCTEDDSVYTVINSAPLGVTLTYDDTDFVGSLPGKDKYYCYFVQGVYGDMISSDNIKPKDFMDAKANGKDIRCIRAGMEACFNFRSYYPAAEEFCSDEVRSTCDANNTIVPINATRRTTEKVDCKVKDSLGTSYFCVGPFTSGTKSGLTECVATSVCDYCNDPFGLFAYSRSRNTPFSGDPAKLVSEIGRAPRKDPTTTEALSRSAGLYVPCLPQEFNFCYLDYTKTTQDKFYERKMDSTCYDYNSLSACVEFNKTDGNCEWAWHPTYGELGIGVCRSRVVEDQECGRCHSPLNKVFGRCDKESCALYGRCYYDLDNLGKGYSDLVSAADGTVGADRVGEYSFYRCAPEREISCEDYDTMADCIGSDSPYSIGGKSNLTSDVLIDVSGYLETEDSFAKLAGSNRVITQSDDFFSFGKCQWPYHVINETQTNEAGENETLYIVEQEHACIKNSDDSPYIVDSYESYTYWKTEFYQHSDCGGSSLLRDKSPLDSSVVQNITLCRKDFSSPITSLPIYQNLSNPMRLKGRFALHATVSDDSLDYSSYYPDTYACVAEEGRVCYPTGLAAQVSREEGNLIAYNNVGVNVSYNFSERGFQSGRHVLRYFSEDVSHNIEEVKNFTIYLDADAPIVTLAFSNVSYEIHPDVWRTNLTMTLSIGGDPAAFCSARFYLGNVSIYPLQDIITEYNNSWTRHYDGLPDNRYRIWYRCEDDVGNVAERNVTILVDGDMSITNPQPYLTVNHGDITISVETGTNADCRYLYSSEERPEFWGNATFDPALFSTMAAFATTGSEAAPRTSHSSPVSLANGYHRYYVKCRMFNDGKIRGNEADQVRFAVDTQPPMTTHTTDFSPYNGWYNRNIYVFLSCGDPSIMGMGLDWAFGCNSSYYCFGLDCADDDTEFRRFTSPIALNSTTYISYYSDDNGRNREPSIENVLFEIDKVPPKIDVQFYDGESKATVLIPNIVYRVRVNASKPFISPAVSLPRLTYTSQPAKFSGDVFLLPTLDPSVWEGVFFIENINANKGYEGNATFTASGFDYHNVSGSGSTTIAIDTKPPASPIIEPSLDNPSREASAYQAIGYPINYRNGTYYTNRASLFVTGYTSEYLDMIAVKGVDGVSEELPPYTQTPTAAVFDDRLISGFAGRNEIRMSGDITRRVNSSLYIGFDSEQKTMGPRRVYGAYGMFYDFTDVRYRGGDEELTLILLYPSLESSLALNKKIFFYDKETPSYWFGFDLPLASFRNTTFYLKSYDVSHNLVRYPAISADAQFITFFFDPVPPSVLSHYPLDGTTSMDTMQVSTVVREGRQESGLDARSINFSINGVGVSYSVEHVAELEAADPSSYYYRLYHSASGLGNGEYYVSVDGKDLSMNALDESASSSHWTFSVDKDAPQRPDFSLVGGFKGVGEDRWYSSVSPDFILDFSSNADPVTIVDIAMEESPTEGDAAVCVNTSYNVFRCAFASPKTSSGMFWADYGVVVKAFKTLDDGTDSPDGEWIFRFTVDDQAPEFIPAFKSRFMDNINLTIGAVVSNENHRLKADIEILGNHYNPLYSYSNGSFYYFVWPVPDYTKADEGNTTITITLSDFAGNSRSVTVPVYIDLTAPRIENISIDISSTVKIGNELFTSQPNVTVSGPFIDEDIESVWIVPGDYNATTRILDDKTLAKIKKVNGVPASFSVSMRLDISGAGRLETIADNFMLINQINNRTIYMRDTAGHESSRRLRVVTDILAPLAPTFCVGADWFQCIPST